MIHTSSQKAKSKKNELSKTRHSVLRLTKREKDLLRLHESLKLQIELVPHTSWFSNVRSNLKTKHWDRIRKDVYLKADYKCEICKGLGDAHPVECHEVWIYDKELRIQLLSHFQAICPACHEVKHIGLAGVRGNADRALKRFTEVNSLDIQTASEIKKAVFKEWRIRSRKKWKIDMELLKTYGIDLSELKKS